MQPEQSVTIKYAFVILGQFWATSRKMTQRETKRKVMDKQRKMIKTADKEKRKYDRKQKTSLS